MAGVFERLWQRCHGSEYVRWQLTFALQAVDGETASVMLLDEAGANLVFCVSVGAHDREYTGKGVYEEAIRVPMSGKVGINPLAVLYGKPICMEQDDPRHNPEADSIVGATTRSLFAVPVAAGDQVVGTLSAINAHRSETPGGFGPRDLEAMKAAAEAVRLWLTLQMGVLRGEPEDLRSA